MDWLMSHPIIRWAVANPFWAYFYFVLGCSIFSMICFSSFRKAWNENLTPEQRETAKKWGKQLLEELNKEPVEPPSTPPSVKPHPPVPEPPSHILTVRNLIGDGWVIEYIGNDYPITDKKISDMLQANKSIDLRKYESSLGIKIIRFDRPEFNNERTLII